MAMEIPLLDASISTTTVFKQVKSHYIPLTPALSRVGEREFGFC
jgi:hypothetical protein